MNYLHDRSYIPPLNIHPTTDRHWYRYPHQSAYVYSFNNPVIYNDTDGKDGKIAMSGNTITVSATVYLKGIKGINPLSHISRIKRGINKTFGKTFQYTRDGQTYDVKFNITVKAAEKDKNSIRKLSEGENLITLNNDIKETNGRSYVNRADGVTGEWEPTDPEINTYSHEMHHLLGLADQYNKETNKNFDDVQKNDMLGTGMYNKDAEITQESIDAIGNYFFENKDDNNNVILKAKDMPLRNRDKKEE